MQKEAGQEICMQVIEPFDVNIPLGSFPAGKYTLWVNGEIVAEFQSYQNEVLAATYAKFREGSGYFFTPSC